METFPSPMSALGSGMEEKSPVKSAIGESSSYKRRSTSLVEKIGEESQTAKNSMTLRLFLYFCTLSLCIYLFVSISLPARLAFPSNFEQMATFLPIEVSVARLRRTFVLPSLNLNDYKEDPVYPVFSSFPEGIPRKEMPQFNYNGSANAWLRFATKLQDMGGKLTVELVDLRLAVPLQSELSGFIIYNVLFGDNGELVRKRLKADNTWFTKRIVLIRTPYEVESVDGSIIPRNSLLILDGHHTATVAQLCAELPHTWMRLGEYNAKNATCGHLFDPKQEVRVVEGLHPLVVRTLALEAGAENGFAMNHYKKKK